MATEFDHLKAQKTAMERRQAERMAQRIADRLFVNGFGERAERLQLRGVDERDLGGWCRKAAEDQIIAALLDAPASREEREP